MISRTMSCAALAAVLLLSIACGSSAPTSPTPAVQAPASSAARARVPPSSGPSRTFSFDHELVYGVRDYTKHSRFVLYDDGTFALQYASLGFEYRGWYEETDGLLTFTWEGWSDAGLWGATGTLQDGSLAVRYNLVMGLSDFEDAAYVLTQSSPQ